MANPRVVWNEKSSQEAWDEISPKPSQEVIERNRQYLREWIRSHEFMQHNPIGDGYGKPSSHA